MMDEHGDAASWRFSSDEFAEERRLSLFRERFEGVLPFEIEAVEGARFFNDVTVVATPGLAIASGVSQGAMFRRTAPLTRQSDDLTLCITSKGRSRAFQRGAEMALGEGDAFLSAADVVSDSGSLDTSDCLSLRLPRAVLAASGIDLATAFARPIRRGSEGLALLTGYLGLTSDALRHGSPALRGLVVSHIHDLVALVLGAGGEPGWRARGRGLTAARLAAIKHDIAQHLSEHGLCADDVARRQGISPSYVRKLLVADGVTFSGFVLERRVGRAHAMLANPRLSNLSVSEVAYEVGFGDLSYFNRSFRRTYGVRPSDVRAATMSGLANR